MPASSDPDGFGVLRSRDLAVLAYAQGFTLWHYKALHLPVWRLMVPGFFDPAGERDRMKRGDMILLSANDGGASAYIGAGAQGVRFILQPMIFPFSMETACPTTLTSPPPPAPPRLRGLLRRLVNPGCWTR